MTEDIDDAFRRNSGLRTIKVGDKMIVSFSPRTAHRPGKAIVSGWRFFLRIGLYTSGDRCSPYPSHYVFFNPAFDLKRNVVVFRMAGRKEETALFNTRSVSLKDAAEEALSFASLNKLAHGGTEGVDQIKAIINNASSPWSNAACA
jgi:hypothetical protein